MAIVAGLFAGLFGRLPQQAAALLAWPFPAYTIRVVEWRAGLPGSAIVVGTPRAAAVAAFYLVLFGITFGWPAWRRWWLARRAEAQPGAADSERPAPSA